MTDRIILSGNSKLLQPIITQMLAMQQMLEGKDIGTIYGEPSIDFQVRRKFKPQIELFFIEDADDVITGYQPVQGRVSFRIMDEESNTITKAKLTNLAQKIKDIFGQNGGYIWRKGKELYSYTDSDKGYNLQILSRSNQQAVELATKILLIQNHNFILGNMQLCKNQDELNKYPYDPPTQVILGETVKVLRYRPNVEVRFSSAVAHIHGIAKAKLLYSRNTKRQEALVK